jgi:hypothetical protein
MKKFALLLSVALFASPIIASAAIGTGCNTDAECDTSAGEYCDAPAGGGTYLCVVTTPTSNTDTSSQTGSSGFIPLAPIPGLTQGVNTTSSDMSAFLNNLYKVLIGFAAVAAVVMIIWGGLEYATQDSPWGKSEGKSKITQAIFGLILVLLPVVVFSIINPKILNLSVNWHAIALPGAPVGDAGGGGGGQNPTSGCAISGSYLQQSTCTTPESEAAWETQCTNGGGKIIAISNPVTTTKQTNCRIDAGGQRVCDSVTNTYQDTYCSKTLTGSYSVVNVGSSGWLSPNYDFKPLDNSSQPLFDFLNGCRRDGGIPQGPPGGYAAMRQPSCPKPIPNCASNGNAQPCLTNSSEGKCYLIHDMKCTVAPSSTQL